MAMFHLDYPRKRGFFHWDELACLARALGFPGEIIYNNIPEEYLEGNEENGLKLKTLLFLINVQKCFNQAVDRTINIHTDEWNLYVIKKALHLADINAITFEELYGIRVAFQTYENADTKGLPLNEKTLQRTLKLCNRMISPLKMMQRIKHMKDDFEEDGRIQLHEFLDLILWCEIYEELKLAEIDIDTSKDEVDLYKIDNFEEMLTHYDELLAQRLNNEYRAEELTFVKVKHTSKAMPKDLPPVDPEKRKKQVTFHQENYQYLKNELQVSTQNCHQTKAGYIRNRPITAPDLIMYEAISQSYRVSTLDPRPATVYETIGHLIRPMTGQKSPVSLSDIKDIVPRPEITRYQRPTTPATVSRSDTIEHLHRMQTLDFDMAIVEHKYEQLLQEEMDEFMPGYLQRKSKRPKVETPPPLMTKSMVDLRPSEETLHRLSYHHKREPPRPAHGKACDARYRGWHKVRVKKGSHHVLVEPFHERSNTGYMYTKLRQKYRKEGNVDVFVHRRTKGSDVQPEKPKSRAKKYHREHLPHDEQPQVMETTRSEESGLNKKLVPASYKGSKASLASTGKSSDISWRHLKVYKEGEPEVKEEPPKKLLDRPDYDAITGRVLDMGTVGRVEVLERIKEESGRTTRTSGVHGKTPLGMSHLATKIENKVVVEEPTTNDDIMKSIPPIKPSQGPPIRSTVKVQTPGTQLRQSLGLGDSFYDGLPLKTSTANNPNRRQENKVKLKCLRRLSSRVDGLVSSAMHKTLLSVDLNNVGMPNPGGEKWGGLGLTMSV